MKRRLAPGNYDVPVSPWRMTPPCCSEKSHRFWPDIPASAMHAHACRSADGKVWCRAGNELYLFIARECAIAAWRMAIAVLYFGIGRWVSKCSAPPGRCSYWNCTNGEFSVALVWDNWLIWLCQKNPKLVTWTNLDLSCLIRLSGQNNGHLTGCEDEL